MSEIVILGAGGHAKVLADLVVKTGHTLLGFLDDTPGHPPVLGFPILGRIEEAGRFAEQAQFLIGIGSNQTRKRFDGELPVRWATLVHPAASVGLGAQIGEGTVLLAGAVVNPCAQVGRHCILNTGSVVEHDCRVGDYVHLSPNATLCGTVTVGEGAHVGAGAVVRNNLTIAPGCVLGAGCAVVGEITQSGTYVGVPARRLEQR